MTAEHRHALPEGFEFEGYRIEGLLGTGGFGLTYRAREIELGRLVAIKEYLPNGIAGRESGEAAVHAISAAAQEEFDWGLDRSRGEAKTLVAFRHPNIVNVLRFFQSHGTAYLVMDFVEGETLEAIIARDGPVPEDKLRALLGPLLDGLENIHEAGFLHRDIKPGNIFVRADGTPVLIDFGSARASLGAASKGMTAIVSGGYAPVEQYTTHGKQGPWSDLYGLGATLYHAVAGRPPPEAIERIDSDSYKPASGAAKPGYSETLLAAIDACLALKRAARPQSVTDFRKVLGGRAQPGGPSGQALKSAKGKEEQKTAAALHEPLPQGATILPAEEQAAAAAAADQTAAADQAAAAKPGRGWLPPILFAALIAAAVAAGIVWLGGGNEALRTACVAPPAKDPVKTIAACTTAINSGSFSGAALGELHVAKGILHAGRGEHATAIEEFGLAIAHNPKDKRAHYLRAGSHHAKRAWVPALADYDAAIRLDPDFAEAFEGRGVLRYDTRRYENAVADLTTAIGMKRSLNALLHRGQSHLLLRDYKSALADFDAALVFAPERGELYRMRGVAREFLGRREAAIADYLTALKKDPGDREAKDRLSKLGVTP